MVDLHSTRGAEANEYRPAVVVSNDGANTTAERLGRGVITVVPVTSNTTNIYPFQVFLGADSTGLSRDSKAQAEQVRSVDVERMGALLGTLDGPLRAEATKRSGSTWPSDAAPRRGASNVDVEQSQSPESADLGQVASVRRGVVASGSAWVSITRPAGLDVQRPVGPTTNAGSLMTVVGALLNVPTEEWFVPIPAADALHV